MSRVQLILGFLGFAFFAQVAAHGHLSIPTNRDVTLGKRQDEQNAPVTYPLISDFVCRNYSSSPSDKWTTLVAGSTTPIQWGMEAAHPGDCFAYLSYDGDSIPDTQKKWFKIAEFPQCNLQNTQTLTMNIPSYLPPCDHCILRWEWYALHLQAIDIVEFYAQCADVKIVGGSNGQLPTPQVTIPGHLPMDANRYRAGYNTNNYTLTGPPIATVGGAAYSCVSEYGSSCNVPSPTKNPCTISTQRCMSDTTYQACGIGATTTVWGPEQSCQTGLVCANHSDGVHIMCTYPSVPLTPSSPSTPSSGGCTLQSMRCLTNISDSTYQTCTNGNSGTYWATPQSCQTGQYCVPNGNAIYCSTTKPVTPVSSSSSSSSSSIQVPVASTTGSAPIPVPSTTAAASVPVVSTTAASVPVVMTTGSSVPIVMTTGSVQVPPVAIPPVQVPSSSSSTSASTSSNVCVLGNQKCTSAGSSTYQTCSALRDGSTYWAPAQQCQTELTCHPSATANNIYCY